MNKLWFIGWFLFILGSCSSSQVMVEKDPYRKENRAFIIQQKRAYPEALKKKYLEGYWINLRWIKKDSDPAHVYLTLTFDADVMDSVANDFYIKADKQIFKIFPREIRKKTIQKFSDTVTEIKKKEKESDNNKDTKEKEEEIIEIKHSLKNISVDRYRIDLILDKEILKAMKKAKDLKLHFYINDIGYSIDFNKKEIKQIKKFLSL